MRFSTPPTLLLIKAIALRVTFPLTLFYMPLLYADVPDVGTMLMNFSQTIPQFMQLVTATAYVMGMWFIIKGIHSLKEFGESRTQMSSNASLKGPLIFICVGTALLYLPSSVEVGLSTFWADTAPIGYIQESGDQWTIIYNDAFLIIELIGTISFIRGLVILTRLGSGHGQGGELGRAITHIVAGVMCINLNGFLDAINGTLGITGISSH
jgi:intracellular multiplication protein IcmC